MLYLSISADALLEDADPRVRVSSKITSIGRRIPTTPEDGDAELERAQARVPSSDRGLASPPHLNPRQERALRVEERRRRLAAFHTESEARWTAEVQTDERLEEQLIFTYGPASMSEGLIYLGKVHMPQRSNSGDAFSDVCAVSTYHSRWDKAMLWCRQHDFATATLKKTLIEN